MNVWMGGRFDGGVGGGMDGRMGRLTCAEKEMVV